MTPTDDLWAMMVAAIGQRIDSSEAIEFIAAIRARSLRAVTPRNLSDSTSSKELGISVSSTPTPRYRPYWPERREKRAYVNYINRIMIEPPYPGPLPDGFHWNMAKTELDRRAQFELRGSRQIPYWNFNPPRESATLQATTSIHAVFPPDKPAADRLWLLLAEEDDFITAHPECEKDQPLGNVEAAFFAVWCSLHGLLKPEKFTAAVVQPLHDRAVSPLAFLHGPCERLIWSNDIRPDFQKFMWLYYRGHGLPDDQTWVSDINKVFGGSNHFRDDQSQMTHDTWANYDLIAPLVGNRFAQWQRGELKRANR